MAQQQLLLLPAPSRTFLKPLPSPFLSSLPRRHLIPVSAVRVAPAVRRGLLRYATKRSGEPPALLRFSPVDFERGILTN